MAGSFVTVLMERCPVFLYLKRLNTFLFLAASHGDLPFIHFLLENSGDCNIDYLIRFDDYNYSPTVTELLLEYGAHINSLCIEQQSAIQQQQKVYNCNNPLIRLHHYEIFPNSYRVNVRVHSTEYQLMY